MNPFMPVTSELAFSFREMRAIALLAAGRSKAEVSEISEINQPELKDVIIRLGKSYGGAAVHGDDEDWNLTSYGIGLGRQIGDALNVIYGNIELTPNSALRT